MSPGMPGTVCGYKTPHSGSVPPELGGCVCIRPTWNGTGRCIWHARTKNKRVQQLQAARKSGTERLDGAYLPDLGLRDAVTFENCILFDANFSDADMTGGVFTDAKLPGSDLSGTIVDEARFQSADLRRVNYDDVSGQHADFEGAQLGNVTAIAADFEGADFSDSYLPSANFDDSLLTDTVFAGAILPQAELNGCALERADFTDANVSGTEFNDAILPDANFTSASAEEAEFRSAALPDATFEGASLSDGIFLKADLDNATLHRANLFGADLGKATFYGAITTDAMIDSDTTLPMSQEDDPDRATWTFGTIERLARQNSLSNQARKAYVKRRDVRKEQYRKEGQCLRWVYMTVMNLLMRYGDSWLRVVGSSGVVIAIFGVLYTLVGGVRPTVSSSDPIMFHEIMFQLPEPVRTVLVNLYFSAVTFTTLGYGDIQPATGLSRTLASVESFIGALLIALLVYVFGRRAEW